MALRPQMAWMCISKNPSDTVRADDGYMETIGESYEWVSKLNYGEDIQEGDIIIIRDSNYVIGFSVIDFIESSMKVRQTLLCPKCNVAKVRSRKTTSPKYACGNCRNNFDTPVVVDVMLEHRKAFYGAGWVGLENQTATFRTWKTLSKTPKSQFSMQPVDLDKFELFCNNFSNRELQVFRTRTAKALQGHRLKTVRTRIGQSQFRTKLIEKYGLICAATGPNHSKGLEAAHLYSYSEVGKHHLEGGLLLRRDIHYFFDSGLMSINPSSEKIHLSSELRNFDQYKFLDSEKAKVELSIGVKNWLEIHWSLYGNY